MFALLVRAGFWQLDRADAKQALLDGFAAGTAEPVPFQSLTDADPEDVRYRRVTVAGRYDAARQFMQEGMTENGRPGLHVLTPLRLEDGTTVIVNRGWVPRGATRQDLPDAAVDEGARRVEGRAVPFPRAGMRLGDPDVGSTWPRLVNYPTSAELAEALDVPVAPLQVWLAPDQADGFSRNWAPVEFGPERHIGYAVQWFGLALTLLIIYVVMTVRKRRGGS